MFDRIRIINLPSRADRRRAVTAELSKLGEVVGSSRVAFQVAVRPDEPGGFGTLGARGCFMSHLAVLQEAAKENVASLLILEDDVSFSASERYVMPKALEVLARCPWGMFYGGSPIEHAADSITKLSSAEAVMLAHFVAFTRPTIHELVPYLEAMLERPVGSADGGPMHVDGAYFWFRRDHPEVLSYAAPQIAHQRASATDIHDRRGIDQLPILRKLLIPARAIKNMLRSRA